MGRPKRSDEAGVIYHMLNRANRRATIFHKHDDYEAFERILADALERSPKLELFSYCLMPNHWHLVVRPKKHGEMSRFAQWLGLTHTQRYNAHYHTTGEGHLYQGRYKSFPVQDDLHFLSVCRYIERNAFTAELCESADEWKYGSLYSWRHGTAKEKSLLPPMAPTEARQCSSDGTATNGRSSNGRLLRCQKETTLPKTRCQRQTKTSPTRTTS